MTARRAGSRSRSATSLARDVASLVVVAAACVPGCRPDFDERASRIDGPRILAVRGSPPEAKPGDPVDYDVLVATPGGSPSTIDVAWAFCASPKPLTENDIVSTACLGDGVRALGASATLHATTPADACAVFGPDVPPGGFRPRDPDATGGYFQPLRATLVEPAARDAGAFGLERLVCDLANASADVADAYRKAYVPNRNPKLAPLAAASGGAPLDVNALRVPRGARIVFTASWAAAEAEAYAYFDVARQAVGTRRESMRVSWFATAGTFDVDRTGRAEDDLATASDNGWTAPDGPVNTTFWVVLRDARGGVDFVDHRIEVQ